MYLHSPDFCLRGWLLRFRDLKRIPDCRDEFIKSLNVSLNLAMDYEFDIITPLMWIDKEETWELADKLGGFDLVRNMTLTC